MNVTIENLNMEPLTSWNYYIPNDKNYKNKKSLRVPYCYTISAFLYEHQQCNIDADIDLYLYK